jgi:hypothetical protein
MPDATRSHQQHALQRAKNTRTQALLQRKPAAGHNYALHVCHEQGCAAELHTLIQRSALLTALLKALQRTGRCQQLGSITKPATLGRTPAAAVLLPLLSIHVSTSAHTSQGFEMMEEQAIAAVRQKDQRPRPAILSAAGDMHAPHNCQQHGTLTARSGTTVHTSQDKLQRTQGGRQQQQRSNRHATLHRAARRYNTAGRLGGKKNTQALI